MGTLILVILGVAVGGSLLYDFINHTKEDLYPEKDGFIYEITFELISGTKSIYYAESIKYVDERLDFRDLISNQKTTLILSENYSVREISEEEFNEQLKKLINLKRKEKNENK